MAYFPQGAATQSLQTTANDLLISLDNKTPSLGQKTAANSRSIVLASDQVPIKIDPTGTTTQPISGSVSVTNFPASQPVSGTVAVSNFPATQPVSGSVSVANFPATQTVSGTVTANIGTTNGLALDTNITSLRGQIPTTLGQKTSANSLAVVIASDQPNFTVNSTAPVWSRTATGAITAVSSATIKNAAGRLRALRVLYSGTGTNYFQFHDKVTATAFSNTTLVGFGWELSSAIDSLIFDFEEELTFAAGIAWTLSTTQATFTSSAQTAFVFAEFL